MKSQTEEQKATETKKPRFKIEKLEERIAPRCSPRNWRCDDHGGGGEGCHTNPQGKMVGPC